MLPHDTILALSSPRGPTGLRAILRLSGPHAWPLATSLAALKIPTPGHHPVILSIQEIHLPASLLLFQHPKSYTGEDLAELHLPNSPALLDLLFNHLLHHASTQNIPARLAEPGEFTARAFFNGKLDLTQAEGIAATINAANQSQLRAAAALRNGDLFRWTHATADRLAHLLALVEAGIDFADEEDIRFIEAPQLRNALTDFQSEIQSLLAASRRLARRDRPPTVVFVGQPNVGKSSLINALAQTDRSIVSPTAGTTRDALATTLLTPRGPIQLLDVPGEESPPDELHQKMMATRNIALLEADLIVEVLAPPHISSGLFDTPHLVVHNKSDLRNAGVSPFVVQPLGCSAQLPLADHPPFRRTTALDPVVPLEHPWQLVSAKTGLHLPELRTHLTNLLFHTPTTNHLELNHRHRTLLEEVLTTLHQATALVEHATTHPELLAAELRRSLDLLGQLTGTISPDEVLGRIFSQFCLGK